MSLRLYAFILTLLSVSGIKAMCECAQIENSKASPISYLNYSAPNSVIEANEWATDLHGKGKFWRPTDVAIDDRGMIYIADSLNSRIQIFSPTGKYYTAIGANRFENFSLKWPIAVIPNGDRVFILDAGWSKIFIMKKTNLHDEDLKSSEFDETGIDFADNYFVPPFILEKTIDIDAIAGLPIMRMSFAFLLHDMSISMGASTSFSVGAYSIPGDNTFALLLLSTSSSDNSDCLESEFSGYHLLIVDMDKGSIESSIPLESFQTEENAYNSASEPTITLPEGIWQYRDYLIRDEPNSEDGNTEKASNAYTFFINSNMEPKLLEYRDGKLFFERMDGTIIRSIEADIMNSPLARAINSNDFLMFITLKEDNDGNIWVVDVFGDSVIKYDPDFNRLLTLGIDREKPGAFSGSSMNKGITGICINSDDEVFVYDSGKKTHIIFDRKGHFLRETDKDDNQCDPTKSDYDVESLIIGSHSSEDNFGVVTPSETSLSFFNLEKMIVDNLSFPRGACIGPDGKIYISDSGNDRIIVANENGKLLSVFGSEGTGPGEFQNPIGIAVDSKGYIYVADNGNERIQKFAPVSEQ